jgi:hypothetical protein
MPQKREPFNPLLRSYPDSRKVNSVSVGAETMFTRLIAKSDDLSHYYGEPGLLLAKLYARRMVAKQVTAKDMEHWRDELVAANLVELYIEDGETYIEIVGCRKALRPDMRPEISFPIRNRNGTESDSIRNRDNSVPSTQPNPTQPVILSAFADDESDDSPPDKPQPDVARVYGEDTLPPGFVRWWAAWPRHHRKQARAKCLRFWKSHKLEPLTDAILDALHRCKSSHDWQKRGGEFVPMPLTWLNRTPWETDPDDMPAGTAPIDDDGPTVPGADAEQARMAEEFIAQHARNGKGAA